LQVFEAADYVFHVLLLFAVGLTDHSAFTPLPRLKTLGNKHSGVLAPLRLELEVENSCLMY
jgi:hypothetical protein